VTVISTPSSWGCRGGFGAGQDRPGAVEAVVDVDGVRVDPAVEHVEDLGVEVLLGHGQELGEALDDDLVADAADDDGLVADEFGAFELVGVAVGLDVAGAADAHGPFVDGLVGGVGGVEDAGGLGDVERVGVLVQRVGGDGTRGEPAAVGERGDVEVVVAQGHQESVGIGRDRAGGAAFDGLGHVPGESGVGAVQVGQGGEQRGVAGPSGQDDVVAVAQEFLEGLDAHHGDGVAAFEQLPFDDRGVGERPDAALVVQVLEALCRLVAVDEAEFEVLVVLGGDSSGQAGDPVDAVVASAGAARTDDQRHLEGVAGLEEQAQVAGDGLGGELGGPGAECRGAGVCGAGVAGDHVRAGGHTAVEGGCVEAGTEGSGRGEDTHVHRGDFLLYG
jgi:hypothetical protein